VKSFYKHGENAPISLAPLSLVTATKGKQTLVLAIGLEGYSKARANTLLSLSYALGIFQPYVMTIHKNRLARTTQMNATH